MSKYLDFAKQLRDDPNVHYNCAQSVLAPFAADAGLTVEQACAITANFGTGMKMAATCGAITGGLMVLGLFGIDDPAVIGAYYKLLRDRHEGFLDCGNLLRINKERGGERKPHCDGMVYECIGIVEDILRERGLIVS